MATDWLSNITGGVLSIPTSKTGQSSTNVTGSASSTVSLKDSSNSLNVLGVPIVSGSSSVNTSPTALKMSDSDYALKVSGWYGDTLYTFRSTLPIIAGIIVLGFIIYGIKESGV